MAKKTLVFLLASILIASLSVFSVSAEVSESIDYFYTPGILKVDNAVAGVVYNAGVGSLVSTSYDFLPNYQVRPGVVYQRAARVATVTLPTSGNLFTYGDNTLTTVTTSFRSVGLFTNLPSYNTVHFNFWQSWTAQGLASAGRQLLQLKINGQIIQRNCYVYEQSVVGVASVYSLAVNLTDEVATLINSNKERPYESIELVYSLNFENSEPQTITQQFNIYSRISDVTFTNMELDEALLEAQKQTELLGSIADKLDNIDQKFDDAMQEHDNQQKQEYEQQGNDQSSGIDNVIPDTGNVLSALGTFVGSFSSTDRVAKFPTPALKLPAIEGVIDKEMMLYPAGTVEISSYIQKIPAPLLTLIQVACTLSLCLFFVHEMQSAIDSVLTGALSGSRKGS